MRYMLIAFLVFTAAMASADNVVISPSAAVRCVNRGDTVAATKTALDVALFVEKRSWNGRIVPLDLVRVETGSSLRFDALTWLDTGMDSVVSVGCTLLSGETLVSTRHRGPSSQIRINIGNGVVSFVPGGEFVVFADGAVEVLDGEVDVQLDHPLYGAIQRQIPVGWRYIATVDAMAMLSNSEKTELRARFADLRKDGFESGYQPRLGQPATEIEPYISPVHGY